ncbi:hypothetical protein [Amycolatopsis pithecellobii]|uniref:Uncharacterized protein n=1 Tax=Amycolatopsis pithecellobii TaxID=664692 RepID=A0A6N7YZB8_9PSEU|nr:hypothetical protein [Amycolatopsis pithecellobii]MTD53749.1 hypothetical protein [Amycolatopsis pithecellobii]
MSDTKLPTRLRLWGFHKAAQVRLFLIAQACEHTADPPSASRNSRRSGPPK